MKGNHYKKFGALLLSCVLLLSVGFNALISASANDTDAKVTFSYGDPELRDRTMTLPAGTVTMPNPNNGDTIKNNWSQYRGKPAVSGWLNDETGEYYPAGEVVENVPAGATFTAVFGNNSANFDDLTAGMTVYNDTVSQPCYGSERASIVELTEGNNCVQFDGVSGETGRFQFAPIFKLDGNERFIGFNKNVEYKVTFKYRRTDSTSANSDIYVAFGAAVYNGWRSRQRAVQRIKVTSTEKGMTEFETVTAVVTAPATYAYDGFVSRAVAVAVDLSAGVQIQIDDFKIQPTMIASSTDEPSAKFTYGDGVAAGIGSDSIEIADEDGNVTLPTNESAQNLIWEYDGKYYIPGTTVNIKELGNNVTFNAYFGGAVFDYESINTDAIKFNLSTGNSTNKNLFLELTRNPVYWRVPKGLSNVQVGNYYGTALGHDRVGINAGVGKSGKGLQFNAKNYTIPEYRNAVLFTHTPASFTENDSIAYSYVYYTPNTEYKLEFDYKTTSQVDVAIAFGVSTEWGNENCGTKSVNSLDFDKAGNHITLESSNGEWKHASITVKSPASYTGNGITSARVGVALRDNGDPSSSRASFLDNIEFKSVDLDLGTATFDFGDSYKVEDIKTVRFEESLVLPGKQSPVALRRKGTNSNGQKWSASHGYVSNHTAWYCENNNKYYEFGQTVSAAEVGNNPKFIAVYEKGEVNFDNLPSNFAFVESGKTSYSSSLAKLQGDSNKYVNITGGEAQKDTSVQVILFNAKDQFLSYNTGKTYKVTFKYRRTDNLDTKSSLFFAFGATPYDWRASSNCVNRVMLGDAKPGMTEFETVTAYVTAPNTYEFNTGGSNPQYFYSRTMSIGANLSNGVSIDFDDIKVEAIGRDEVAMTFSVPEVNKQTVVIGKVGSPITIPNIDIGTNAEIDGWYTDKSFTNPFTLKEFPSKGMFVYGKLGEAKTRYYGFTDYPWETGTRSDGTYAIREHQTIVKGLSSDGDGYALKIDNTYSGADSEQQGVALPITIKPNTKYIISYDFYYEKIGDMTSAYSECWFNTTVSGKVWKGHIQHVTNTDEYVPATVETGKWITGYVYGTTSENTWSNYLAIFVRVPVGSVRYIDNIVVTEIPEDSSVAMFKLGSFQSPAPVVAKTNSNITMQKVKVDSNFVFLNWMLNNEDYDKTTYKLEEDTVFTAKTTVRTFGDGFENAIYGERGMQTFGMDLDWEIYDSNKKSPSNVQSGRYSLHKLGNDPRNGAYCLQHNSDVTKYSMAPGKTYTLTFWVKVENPVHKLGSIDIASCMSLANPWDFTSDLYNVVSIADIADGEWHKVSYTFLASSEYLTFRVPGNLSIYIDNITVEYAMDAQKSENCEFEEYLPAFLTEDGKYVKPGVVSNKLEKFQLVKRATDAVTEVIGNSNNVITVIIIVSVVVLLLGAAGTVLFVFIRKKRKM